MIAAFLHATPRGDHQPARQRLAPLGALLARDGEQFGVVVGRQIAREAGIGGFLAVPRSEEHTSELQSLMRTSYAVFCLKKKKLQQHNTTNYIRIKSPRE